MIFVHEPDIILIHLVSASRMYNILRDLLVLNDKVETAVSFSLFYM